MFVIDPYHPNPVHPVDRRECLRVKQGESVVGLQYIPNVSVERFEIEVPLYESSWKEILLSHHEIVNLVVAAEPADLFRIV
jgi:hypothetical protein